MPLTLGGNLRTKLPPSPSTPPPRPPRTRTPPRLVSQTGKATPSCCTPPAQSRPEALVFRHGA